MLPVTWKKKKLPVTPLELAFKHSKRSCTAINTLKWCWKRLPSLPPRGVKIKRISYTCPRITFLKNHKITVCSNNYMVWPENHDSLVQESQKNHFLIRESLTPRQRVCTPPRLPLSVLLLLPAIATAFKTYGRFHPMVPWILRRLANFPRCCKNQRNIFEFRIRLTLNHRRRHSKVLDSHALPSWSCHPHEWSCALAPS